MPRESANTSSGSSGVTNAARSAVSSSRLAASPRCSASRTPSAAAGSPAAHAPNASSPSSVTATWRAQQPEHVGRLGQEPPPPPRHDNHPHSSTAQPPSTTVAGIVIAHARPIWRTTAQRTWCQRRRPTPTPITEEATTWVVDTGAPTTEAPRITPAEAVWLARPVDGLDAVDAATHGADDPPAAQRRAHGQRRSTHQLHPQRAPPACRSARRPAAERRSHRSTSARRWRRG